MYYSSGLFTETFQSINGCDSVVNLDLSIYYSQSTFTSIVACDSYNWNGNTYYATGFYTDTLQSIYGCDSIATISLLIKYSSIDTL